MAMRFSAGVLSLGMMLTACGGGGVNSTPTPTPTPVVYNTVAELFAKPGDKSFQVSGVSWEGQLGVFQGGSHTFPFGDGFTIEFLDADNTYRVSIKGGATYDFTPSTLTMQSDDRVQYFLRSYPQQQSFEIAIPSVQNVPLSYTRFATLSVIEEQNYTYTNYYGAWGVPTRDMPKTGTATYDLALFGAATHDNVVLGLAKHSGGKLSANFASGAVTTDLSFSAEINGNVTLIGTLTGNATIASGTSGFGGTLSGSDGGSGVFGGGFFGPKAAEVGYTWWYDGPEMHSSQGTAAGPKH